MKLASAWVLLWFAAAALVSLSVSGEHQLERTLLPSTLDHPFGFDAYGRDVLFTVLRASLRSAGFALGAVAFSLVAANGLSFPQAMGVIVVEGLLITVLVLTGVREAILNAIPMDLKRAIGIGIGAFIALIGLVNAGVVTNTGATPLSLAGELTPADREALRVTATAARQHADQRIEVTFAP